jgi:hypothetical protein
VILEGDPIVDFLEHHGVKGQKWGVRRKQNRIARQVKRQQGGIDRYRRVAKGKGSLGDKLTVGLNTSLYERLREGSLQNVAKSDLETQRRIQKDILNGKRKTRALLLKSAGVHISELKYNYRTYKG